MKRSTTMILLLLFCGYRDTGGDSIRGFHFRARLFSKSKHSESAWMRKGLILQPIDPGNRAISYQPVILCRDVQMDFDKKGLSQEVDILGFCSGPGMAIP